MKNTVSLSIITLTKNRAGLLEKCLGSLCGQLSALDEIIIIDNCSKDNTKTVIQKYSNKFIIHAFESKLVGYPNLYNFAVSKSSNTLLVFLDDDCVVTKSYIHQIREWYSTKTGFVLQGKTKSLPRKNILAELSEDHLDNWIDSNMYNDHNLTIIDNRNTIIPITIFNEVGGFSPTMKVGSEDVELGMRMVGAGIPIYFDPLLVAYHNERTSLKSFLLQHMRIANSHAVLDKTLTRTQKISMFNKHTWKRHMQSFINREAIYFHEKRYIDALYLPIIYILLGLVRIVGYLRAPKI